MKHKHGNKAGFTLVEVALFLAVTALLFAGVVGSMNGTAYQQRFNDSVQNFAEFLRSVYSGVSNPQSTKAIGEGGRSEYAMYGKLIVFGEDKGLDGNGIDQTDGQRIYVYDVVAEVKSSMAGGSEGEIVQGTASNGLTGLLSAYNANVFVGGNLVGAEDYKPRWGARIEGQIGDVDGSVASTSLFTGSILVVRHPQSGVINTLVSTNVVEVNNYIGGGSGWENVLKNALTGTGFDTMEVNFCVNPSDVDAEVRRNVRIQANARNASGVEVIELNNGKNKCGNPGV